MVAGVKAEAAIEIEIAVVPVAGRAGRRFLGREAVQMRHHIALQALDALGDDEARRRVRGHGEDDAVVQPALLDSLAPGGW